MEGCGAGHAKMVTAIAVDTKGARVLTGSEDSELRMFDFGGMKRDMRSFRSLTPSEGCAVNAISFSPTGKLLLPPPAVVCSMVWYTKLHRARLAHA